jgi:hypothetical protein
MILAGKPNALAVFLDWSKPYAIGDEWGRVAPIEIRSLVGCSLLSTLWRERITPFSARMTFSRSTRLDLALTQNPGSR